MLDQKEIALDGKTYVIQQLPASRGMKAAIAIAHIFSGASKGFGFANGPNIEDTPINIAAVVSGIVDNMDVEATPAFVKTLVIDSVIRPEIKSDDFEREFSGEYDRLWGLVAAIIEHNRLIEALKKRLSPLIDQLFSGNGTTPTASTPSIKDPS